MCPSCRSGVELRQVEHINTGTEDTYIAVPILIEDTYLVALMLKEDTHIGLLTLRGGARGQHYI